MRINIVIGPFLPVPPLRGGAVERIQLALATEFAKLGHEVTMISRRFPGLPNEETVDGVHHIRVPSTDAPKSKLAYRALDVVYAARVSAMLPPADVTLTNSVFLPLVLPRRRAGLIYVSVARMPKGQMGLYRRADRLQAVSNAVAAEMTRQSPSIADKIKVIANPLSHAYLERAPKERAPRAKRILYLGRIAEEKGINLLIDAFCRLAPDFPDWETTIVGPGEVSAGGDGIDYLNALKARSTAFADRIHWPGAIFDLTKLVDLMQDSEIFVYPSVAEQGESFGMAPLEAMSCGCAVIVSALECFSDFIKPGQNGLQFNHRADAVPNLERVLRELMSAPDERTRLGAAAIQTAHEFSPHAIARAFIADFEDLLARSGSGSGSVVQSQEHA